MEKSPDAFRTISEVADHLDTPAHVLRFWESRFPQIRPVKRAGGRRYYRPSDVALLAGIRRLLHDEGMTIRGVQKILREQGVRHVAGLTDEEIAADEGEAMVPAVTPPKAVVPSAPIPFPLPPRPPVAAETPADAETPQLALALDPAPAPDLLARLRAMPPGALAGRAAGIIPLAERLAVLIERTRGPRP